jgi:hypothetical protein
MLCARDLDKDIGLQAQLDAACRYGNGAFCRSRRIFGSAKLSAQVNGFEVITVFPVPLLTLPAMIFFNTFSFSACLLSANLPRVGQKPSAANRTGSLACTCHFHRALSYRSGCWHDFIECWIALEGRCLGLQIRPVSTQQISGQVGPITAGRWVHF